MRESDSEMDEAEWVECRRGGDRREKERSKKKGSGRENKKGEKNERT